VLAAAAVGAVLGVLAGGLVAEFQPLTPWAQLAGGLAGLITGLVLGLLQVRAILGRGVRTSAEPLPTTGPALNEHFRLLRDTLTTSLALRPSLRVQRLEGHHGRVLGLAVSPDGQSALSAGQDHTVRLWDLASGFEVRTFAGFDGPVHAVAFSPDGRLAAAAGEHAVRVYDVESGRELRRFETAEALRSLAFLPRQSPQLLLGGENFLRVWDVESAEVTALISLSQGLVANDTALSLAASPDGRHALVGCWFYEETRLIDLERGECVRRFTGHRSWLLPLPRPASVSSVAFSPDGRRVLTGSLDQTARVWEVDSGTQLARFRGHCGLWGWRGVTGVAFRGDGKQALSAGEDGTVRLWESATGREMARFQHGARVCCLTCTPAGRLALSGGKDGVIRVWDLSAEGPP
jgi:WD40 repeat protein